MDVPSPETHSSSQSDRYPLLLEQMENPNSHVHAIDVTRDDDTSSSSSLEDQPPRLEVPQPEDRLPHIAQAPTYQTASSNRSSSRSSSFMRQGDRYSRRRSPLNSGLWISVELLVTMSQIIASIVVPSLSTNENPQAPLFTWIVGYASGCVATLPILYWRFCNRNWGGEVESTQSHQGSSERNPTEPMSYTSISITPASGEESNRTSETVMIKPQVQGPTLKCKVFACPFTSYFIFLSLGWVFVDTVVCQVSWLNGLVDHFKMGLDCFFAVWFVVGNVWIFGGHTSPSDAPKLYRLCIVFLTFSCIGYAMPFILCATICCCLPCIISVLGFREDLSQIRGATIESINALPTYKYKQNRNWTSDDQESNTTGEGELLAAGTENERAISKEDVVCSICLANYSDDDEPHAECVDKWLKINASCPLCKSEVGDSSSTTPARDSSQQ